MVPINNEERMITDLVSVLKKDTNILAVVLYGSYARKEKFNDIDICIFLTQEAEKIKDLIKMHYLTAFPEIFDIHFFSDLPIMIQSRVLQDGVILINNDYDQLFDLYIQTIKEFSYFEPQLRLYLGVDKKDENRIMFKIRLLESYLEKVQDILPDSFADYTNSLVHKLAVERILHLMIETVIDITILVIKDLHFEPPKTEESIFEPLKDKIRNIEKLKEMRRFRNILVHKYGNIDNNLVYKHATENLDDFAIFIEDMKNLIKNYSNHTKNKIDQ
jgi:uncharacterized protein YutE (UPF0331/DUF86 family)/predicted nucleotidyltransferase